VVQRHFSSGIDCAMAGAATAADAANPALAVFKNSRRFMTFSLRFSILKSPFRHHDSRGSAH